MMMLGLTTRAAGALLGAGLLAGCAGGTIPRYPYDLFAHGTSPSNTEMSTMKSAGMGATTAADPGSSGSHGLAAKNAGSAHGAAGSHG